MQTVVLRMPAGRPISISGPRHFAILRQLRKHGGLSGYEPETMACALACCSSRDGAFIDVGANVGLFSLVVSATLGTQAHAFEPTPELAAVLERTAGEYGLPISCHRLALSDRAGSVLLYLSRRSDASNSLIADFRPGSPAIEVRTETLDRLNLASPALIKIDVETAEALVLRGGANTIARHRPFIIAEILNNELAHEIGDFFASLDYAMYHISASDHWERSDRLTADGTFIERNWLFAPSEITPDFQSSVQTWKRVIDGLGTINPLVASILSRLSRSVRAGQPSRL